MPKGVKGFVKGNTFGGYRENSGRPTNDEREEILTLAQAIEREGQRRAARIAKRYYEMADEDPATMRHVVDGERIKNGSGQPAAIIHQFIQFGSNHSNTLQLPAEGLPGTVLGSDDSGAKAPGGDDLAPAQRQGQDSIEFRSFANVPGKRR